MLDGFEILSSSGVVLWRRHYVPISPHLINSLIADVFIEDKQSHASSGQQREAPSYKKDKHTLRWTAAKDVGLVFVAVYQSLLHLSWVNDLLVAVKTLFLKAYTPQLKQQDASHIDCRGFDQTFDALVRKLDTGTSALQQQQQPQSDSDQAVDLTPPSSSASTTAEDDAEPPPPPIPGLKKAAPKVVLSDTSTDATPIPTPDTSRPATPLQKAGSHLLSAKSTGPGKGSRRARKAGASAFSSSAPVSSGDERAKGKTASAKAKRRWDADGFAAEGEEEVLDYSTTSGAQDAAAEIEDVDAGTMGSRVGGKGAFVLKDLDDEVDAILASSHQTQSNSTTTSPTPDASLLNSATSRITGLFRNVLGGNTLTKTSLQAPLQAMQTHLLEKNVAREAAERLCSAVETDLLNQKTASYTSIDATIRASMTTALTRMLTPTSSLDLLREITSTTTGAKRRPYVISIVGVNGVGKSTNLSKIAYFLLQNHFRVLVVAGDTFRSGAVEQLRVHVTNLSALAAREKIGRVDLFEKGYGKDAAAVAKEAVAFASTPDATGGLGYDVVLIDTAGRRHNDSRLMSSLTKFGQWADPDKIFMVGEALVGSDSVAQARNFASQFLLANVCCSCLGFV